MKNRLILALAMSLYVCNGATAGFGYFGDGGSFAIINGTTYQLGASSGGQPAFQDTDFGCLTTSDSLVLNGFQTFSFENSGDNAHTGRLQYSISGGSSGTIATSSFTDLGGGDNLHENTTANVNLLPGLSPGTYTLSLYTELDATYNGNPFPQDDDTIWQIPDGSTIYESSSGSPHLFTATFKVVVPEPSGFLCVGLVAFCCIGYNKLKAAT